MYKPLLLKFLFVSFLISASLGAFSQKSNTITVKGRVVDEINVGLPATAVTLKGTQTGTTTNVDGQYSIEVPADGTLSFSFLGYKLKEVPINGKSVINVTLEPDASSLDEVSVVAFGTQKKSSMIGAITTINPKELKGPTSNLTNMLAGRLSGVIAYQRSGEPGLDNSSFFIRGITSFGSGKVDPLILIDGIESTQNDLARLQPDDIESFSVLKDATAASLFGARGANGVVLIITKTGNEGKAVLSFRAENSLSSNTKNFQFADNITYMNLANEASISRSATGETVYSRSKIENTIAGNDPFLFPNNNWINELVKDYTNNQRFNLNLKGGGKNAQYYISGTYNIDNGVLKVDKLNNFNSNIKLKNYAVRSNVNINLTPTTEAIIRTSGQFDDYTGPIGGGAQLFKRALRSNPVMFPAKYPADKLPFVNHPLFGSAIRPGTATSLYSNPYAASVSGYQDYNRSTLTAQIELKQKLDFITSGLSARAMTYTQRYSYFDVARKYNPFYYSASSLDDVNYSLEVLNPDSGTEYLSYSPGEKKVTSTAYTEAAINYNKSVGKSEFGAMTIGILRNFLTGNADDLQGSLPKRNLGISGRATYAYDSRYLFEFNFGYNGSERFAQNNRFGFFPSVGLGWNLANEKFFEPLKNTVSKLKFRATYGLVGNDQIGSEDDRFFYLSNVNPNSGANAASFGTDFNYRRNGYSISRYENNLITWEKAYKANMGMELGLFKDAVDLQVDVFKERRTNILLTRSFIPSTMGLTVAPKANVGEAEGKGLDVSLNYNKNFGKNVWLQTRGNFTYATSKILVNEEPSYPSNEFYLSKVGNSNKQEYGLIAERLFVDQNEINNSPKQFGTYLPGDIKYRDVNRDGVINSSDQVAIGYPTVPEIIYGFGFSLGYKAIDFSAFFQGSARSSFFISPSDISPFVVSGNDQNGLLKAIADNHWSFENNNLYSFWPRLGDVQNSNNNQKSTWWMRNGNFLRLKTVELGLNIPRKTLDKAGIKSTRIYVNSNNLFTLSNFKLWDVEMGGNGLGYPVQTVINIGLNVSL